MGEERLNVSSSGLAKTLDETINGGDDHHLSLTGVPAVIPCDIEETDLVKEILQKIVYRGRQYRDVFLQLRESFDENLSGTESLVARLDALLTSLAPPKQSFRFYPEEQAASGIDRGELEQLVQYDIGGINIPYPDLSEDRTKRVAFWNSRWTGITLQHYTACAERAAVGQLPGVIVVAIGANKAAAVLDSVRRGLVNTLLIDDDLAKAMRAHLNV